MFYSLTGKVVFKDLSCVALQYGGVAFRIQTSANTLQDIDVNGTPTLYTYLNVREDALDVFGFSTEYELSWFKLLIGVSGVGPKVALAILSEYTPDRLALFISAGDSKAITRASGVGPKLAQRIVLELKDKVKSVISNGSDDSGQMDSIKTATETPNSAEAISALTMLGYTQSEASVAVSKTDITQSVESIIKQALKILSRQV